MKKFTCRVLLVSVAFCVPAAFAAPGESWEVTTRTEMPGMPAGMGDNVSTMCVPKGSEKDPKYMMEQDGECEMSDIKTSGSKTTWKMRCNSDGGVMSGTGEVTHKGSSYKGVAKMAGNSGGQAINMTANFSGKRVGGACDTSAGASAAMPAGMGNVNDIMGMYKSQMAGAMAEQCEVSNFETLELISSRFFGPTATCAGKEKFACKMIAKDVKKNPDVFAKLAKFDDTSDISIAKTCNIDMAAVSKVICTKVDDGNYQDLEDYCPNEAKAFASGRSYTSGARTAGAVPAAPGSSGNSVGKALDNAQKLKNLMGF